MIVVTDGERILGIGDQGVGGLGIPIGKLSLYSLIGGIRPDRTLPIVLDVGTNNQERLDDPEYFGWRNERITGQDYLDFIDAFVDAVKEELPDVCLQWEDFASTHARPLLERYRDQLLTFNDDVQGTASVALGAIIGAISVTGGKLTDQRIIFLGAGSAGIGVADYLRAALVSDGLSEEEARRRFWIVDKNGLLEDSRTDLEPDQAVYAQPASAVADWPRSAAGQTRPRAGRRPGAPDDHDRALDGRTARSARKSCATWPRTSTGRSSSRSPTRRATARRQPRT